MSKTGHCGRDGMRCGSFRRNCNGLRCERQQAGGLSNLKLCGRVGIMLA